MSENNHLYLLKVSHLRTEFYLPDGVLRAVDDMTFSIRPRETLCIVGESGCGKSVTAMSIIRLIPDPPGKIVGGDIIFEGENLLQFSADRMREVRGNHIAMIFQEPMTALNPLFTVGNQISEVYMEHAGLSRKQAWEASVEIMGKVGIPSPAQRAKQYIHEMSGGMMQRAMIAMAMACDPKLLIADEPTTALDVTIQAQILNLMKELQTSTGTAILMITHNLGVVAEVADRVIVMYLGRVVEDADVDTILAEPLHPYTKGLIASIPFPGRESFGGKKKLYEIPGVVPSMLEQLQGCNFCTRCREAMDICRQQSPKLMEIANNHKVACWKLAEQ